MSSSATTCPERDEPADFDDFWTRTLAEAREFDLGRRVHAATTLPLTTVDVYDVSFAGWGGHRINGWFLVPRGAEGPLPCVMHYIGYSGGRGFPHDHLIWPAAGYAVFVMETRGQGGVEPRAAPASPATRTAATTRRRPA